MEGQQGGNQNAPHVYSDGNTQKKGRVIICSNVLPVHLVQDDDGEWSTESNINNLFEEGAIYAQLDEIEDFEVIHVGVPDAFIPEEERSDVTALLREVNCVPVYLDRDQAHNHFQGYCKGVLYPVLHNIIDLYSAGQDSIDGVLLRSEKGYKAPSLMDAAGMKGSKGKKGGHSKRRRKQEELAWNPVKQLHLVEAEETWSDYCAVNRLFAMAVVEGYKPDDVVWVHDYPLLLLPSFVRKKVVDANIGIFLHTPFPSSEIFRTLSARSDILRAMLCADHIGFHLFEYARHFLTCCSRMLGIKYEGTKGGTLRMKYYGRSIMVTCSYAVTQTGYINETLAQLESPVAKEKQEDQLSEVEKGKGNVRKGINHRGSIDSASDTKGGRVSPKIFANSAKFERDAGPSLGQSIGKKSSTTKLSNSSSKSTRDSFQFLGIDQVEGLNGIPLKLIAFNKFLHLHPSRRNGKVRLKQVGLLLDSRPADYMQTHREIIRLVEMINQTWGAGVVQYSESKNITLAERLGLFMHADALVVSGIRKGISAMPFEYMLARHKNPGVLLLSEFVACSRVLNGSIRFNPRNTEDVAMKMETTVSMTRAERSARRSRDLPFIERNSVVNWARRVLKDVVDAKHEGEAMMAFGFGFGARFQVQDTTSLELPIAEVVETYSEHERRVIVLDYSGTLVETSSVELYLKSGGNARSWHYEGDAAKRRPGGCLETRDEIACNVKQALINLTADERNTVVVVSNDLRDELEQALRGIPNLVLVAENGFVFRVSEEAGWESVLNDTGAGDWYGGGLTMDEVNDSDTMANNPMDELSDDSWQGMVHGAMDVYANRTNGAFIWTAPSAVSYNYLLADPEFGAIQSQNLALELEKLLAGLPLTIEQGKGFVTVRLRGVNRGAALDQILYNRGEENIPDWVFCVGDDLEDDQMFEAVQAFERDQDGAAACFTCRIGSGAHKATYHLSHPEDLHDVLFEFESISKQMVGRRTGGRTEGGGMVDMRRSMSTGGLRDSTNGFKTKQTMLRGSMHRFPRISSQTGVAQSHLAVGNYNQAAGKGMQMGGSKRGKGDTTKKQRRPSPSILSLMHMDKPANLQGPESSYSDHNDVDSGGGGFMLGGGNESDQSLGAATGHVGANNVAGGNMNILEAFTAQPSTLSASGPTSSPSIMSQESNVLGSIKPKPFSAREFYYRGSSNRLAVPSAVNESYEESGSRAAVNNMKQHNQSDKNGMQGARKIKPKLAMLPTSRSREEEKRKLQHNESKDWWMQVAGWTVGASAAIYGARRLYATVKGRR